MIKEKNFKYEIVTINKDKFKDICSLNNLILYIVINGNMHYIEVVNDKYILDYDYLDSFDELINYDIDGVKIKDLKKINIISYNGSDPKKIV